MRLIQKMTQGFDKLVDMFHILSAILIAYNMVIVSIAVFMRYILKRAPMWVIEISEYSLLYITFLGATWVLVKDAHVKMDIILLALSPKKQAFINILTSIICAAVCLIIALFGASISWDYFQANYLLPTVLRPPAYIIISIVPIGCLLLFIQFIRKMLGYFTEFRRNR